MQVKHPMTMTEKIIAGHSDSAVVRPGNNIWTQVDKLLTHDVCGPGTFGIFQREFGEDAEVWDREKVILIPDHYIFTSDERANRNVDILRDMAHRYRIKYFYDITDRSDFRANPDYKGVCHVALAQEGHCLPGQVMFGTDSHTCNAGAFGQFASGVGNTDAGFILGTGKLLVKVPPTMRFALEGAMPHYLLAKDLILHIIGEIGVAGATYRAMEFVGDAVSAMNMDERMTICNMVVEAGGKNGLCPPDATTFDYVTQRTSEAFEPVYADAAAGYVADYTFDVSKLEPTVAAPHSPDNRKLARECRDVKIDRVYIGCACACAVRGGCLLPMGKGGVGLGVLPNPKGRAWTRRSRARGEGFPCLRRPFPTSTSRPHAPTPQVLHGRQDRGLYRGRKAAARRGAAGQGAHLPRPRDAKGACEWGWHGGSRGRGGRPGVAERHVHAAAPAVPPALPQQHPPSTPAACTSVPAHRCGRTCTPCPCPGPAARRRRRFSRRPGARRRPRPAARLASAALATPTRA